MKRAIKSIVMVMLALFALTSCNSEAGPLLKGTAKFMDPETEFAINFSPDGSIYTIEAHFFKLGENGEFEFNKEMEDDFGNYDIMIGNKLYGVRLEKGKTVILNIVETAKGEYALSFSGDNADISEVMSTAFPAYDLYTYSNMTDEEATPEQFLSRLEEANKKAIAKLDLISDAKNKEYYTELLHAMYIGTKARILQDKATDAGVKPITYPEYKAIIDEIDPNSDVSYYSYNSLLWIGEKVTADVSENMLPTALETMDVVEKYITNEKVRKTEAYAVPYTFFAYGDHKTGKEEFWTRYKEFAKDYPEYIKQFEAEYNKEIKEANGAELPDIDLTKPDGSKVKLSSLYGKYIYVDCWATWCGPCCKQIPHLEKLVARMADQDKVVFVSFSMDSDLDAWKRKLDEDKPEWAQFVLDEEANKTLSEALNITGIPRFFIIDPEGKVCNPDAKRPSEETLEEELRNL